MSTILSNKFVATKKPHRCFGCCGTIPVGATARKSSWIFDGEFISGYICAVCDIVLEDAFLEEWFEGDLINEDWESAAQKFEERTGKAHNSAIMPLPKAATA